MARRISYSTLFRRAALRHLAHALQDSEHQYENSLYSCHAIEYALADCCRVSWWGENPVREYAEMHLLAYRGSVSQEVIWTNAEYYDSDFKFSVRFMFLLFLSEETKHKKLYVNHEEEA